MSGTAGEPDFDPLVAEWLEGGPDRAPEAVLATVVAAMPSVLQRGGHSPSSARRLSEFGLVGMAALLVVAVIGSGLLLLRESTPTPAGGQQLAAGASVPFSTAWIRDDGVAVIIRSSALSGGTYWRAATFDRMGPNGWEQSDRRTVTRPAGSPILEGTVDDPGPRPGFRTVAFTAMPASPVVTWMVSPGPPVTADVPVELTLSGQAGFFAAMDAADRSNPLRYTVTAQVPIRGEAAGELNAAVLRAAGTSYPRDVVARYLQLPPGTIGPNAAKLRDRIVASAPSAAPFDIAQRAETVLRSPEFTYDTDVSDQDCRGVSVVECFARDRQGFCLQYATTMAAILRDLGIPVRLVEGFLPGTVTGDMELIRNRDAHTWVEVYFPGHGWVAFDPTGGSRPGQVVPLR